MHEPGLARGGALHGSCAHPGEQLRGREWLGDPVSHGSSVAWGDQEPADTILDLLARAVLDVVADHWAAVTHAPASQVPPLASTGHHEGACMPQSFPGVRSCPWRTTHPSRRARRSHRAKVSLSPPSPWMSRCAWGTRPRTRSKAAMASRRPSCLSSLPRLRPRVGRDLAARHRRASRPDSAPRRCCWCSRWCAPAAEVSSRCRRPRSSCRQKAPARGRRSIRL